MSEKEKKPTFKWLEKLKRVKHIEIYVAVIFVVILLLIYFSGGSNKKNVETSPEANELTITAYVSNLESNLENILCNIGGVSNVNIMITLDMSQATVENSQLTLNKFPPIKGIIVTAKGVNNTTARMKVLHAIQAVVDVSNGSIEILCSD